MTTDSQLSVDRWRKQADDRLADTPATPERGESEAVQLEPPRESLTDVLKELHSPTGGADSVGWC